MNIELNLFDVVILIRLIKKYNDFEPLNTDERKLLKEFEEYIKDMKNEL